jgi:hypothetical protein
VLELRFGGSPQADQQPHRLGAERGEVAQVHRGRLVAEVAERRPVEPEMDPFGEDVERRNPPVAEERPFRVLARGQTEPFELPQEPELTDF